MTRVAFPPLFTVEPVTTPPLLTCNTPPLFTVVPVAVPLVKTCSMPPLFTTVPVTVAPPLTFTWPLPLILVALAVPAENTFSWPPLSLKPETTPPDCTERLATAPLRTVTPSTTYWLPPARIVVEFWV